MEEFDTGTEIKPSMQEKPRMPGSSEGK
jgi:hypothetical protein